MLIEAIEHPIRYQWPNGEIRLLPGKPVEIPDEIRALKVLAKAPGKVRVFKKVSPEELGPGVNISWDSPLFGRAHGEIMMGPESGWLVVRCHSVTGGLALIGMDWGLRIEKCSRKG